MNTKLFLLCLLYIGFTINMSAKDYIITDYGVHSDSTQISTSIIQSIINKAEAEGGGTIVIPKGTYLSGALFFKPNTKLRLEAGAVLKGVDDITHYPLIPSRMEGKNIYYYAALVNAYYVDGFEISGPGTINGNGQKFWSKFWTHRDSMNRMNKPWTNLEVHRPRLVFVWGCDSVRFSGTKFCNSGYWTIHLFQCNNILIENCDIRSPYKAPSTDGIDLDVCSDAIIRNCYIAVDDDAVCIKGGKGPLAHKQKENGSVENILIENCSFGHAHGTLTMGSESIHARNIIMRNCKVNNNCSLLRLKMRPDTYQIYENITIENITGVCGSIIAMAPWKQFYNMENTKVSPKGIVRNITIKRLKVKCNELGTLNGNSNDSVDNIILKEIDATVKKMGLNTKYKNVKLENVKINNIILEHDLQKHDSSCTDKKNI